MNELSFTLAPPAPFRLDLTALALCRRPHNRIDRWDGHSYRRILLLGSRSAPIASSVWQERSGSTDAAELQVTLAGSGLGTRDVVQAQSALRRLLGLDIDLGDFYRMAAADPELAPLAQRWRGLRPPRFPSVFETLTNAIACQQITLTVGITLLNRLIEAYGRAYPEPDAAGGSAPVSNAFPTPQELTGVPPESLRSLGFSRQKAHCLIELATAIADGSLDFSALEALDNASAVRLLRRLHGVGRWSAEYVLLRALGRLDVFPGDDVGARNNLQRWRGRAEKLNYEGVRQATARWRPYSGLVYFHLLLDSLEQRGMIPPEQLA